MEESEREMTEWWDFMKDLDEKLRQQKKDHMNSVLYPEKSSPDDWIDQLCKEIEDE